jgi:hypothetical protein
MIKFLGTSDETTVCGCCGKRSLKRTVALDIDGTVVYYGSDCAAKAMSAQGKKVTKSDVDLHADVFAYAAKWSQVRDLKIVATGIWNKFGFPCSATETTIRISGVGEFNKEGQK